MTTGLSVRNALELARAARPSPRSRARPSSVCLPAQEPAEHDDEDDQQSLDRPRRSSDPSPRIRRIVFDSVRMYAAAMGPISPPTPPSSETPPSTTAATLLSV